MGSTQIRHVDRLTVKVLKLALMQVCMSPRERAGIGPRGRHAAELGIFPVAASGRAPSSS